MPVARDEFKRCLGCWASGVTIVTSQLAGDVHGMTVSAFTSVSLDPPLILVCADKSSDTHGFIQKSGVFAVNLLATGQNELSNRFAWGDEATRFDGVAWRAGRTGAPVLEEALASLDCRVTSAHDAGDHVIYVGAVEAVEIAGSGAPLLYYQGGYRELAPGPV